MRPECLEIRGVAVTSGKDTNEIVKKICEMIDVVIFDVDISVSHRIPLYNIVGSATTSDRHPARVVKFTNQRTRDRLYKSITELKNSNISDIGLGRYSESNIFIQENLTETKRKLFKKCLKFCKNHKFKFTWTYYGMIYLRHNDHSSAIRITSAEDLEKLQTRAPTSEFYSTPSTEQSSRPS